jgi:hypothetical protein
MTNEDTPDELAGIFDDLSPEDFNVETTAIEEISRTNEGVDAFNSFVDEQMRAYRVAWVANHGRANPIAVLASPTMQRVFTPDAEETLGEYVKRLHREAIRMEAIWIFSARKTIVGSFMADEDTDIGDPEVIAEAMAAGKASEGVEWFAERREGDENHQRFGIMQSVDGRLSEPREAASTQSAAWWALVLGS